MSIKSITLTAQTVIWACLAVIIFSPLYVNTHLFFPYIVTKTVAFSLAVEVMFLAFLVLAWKNPQYRLRISLVGVILAIYLLILTLASVLGNDFYHSFWSNNERSDGILLLIHLWLFVLVLTSFFRKINEWLIIFDTFLAATFAVCWVAFDQFMGWNHFGASSDGSRLASTIGNSGYVAGYLIFGVFFAIFMLFKRKDIYLKILYGLLALFEIFIIINTQTRGGIIALFIGGVVMLIYLSFFYFKDVRLKLAATAILFLAIASVVLLFTNKNSDFVKNNPVLTRISSISLTDMTANNRLVTWNIAMQGWKEKFLLGYGQENFYQVFDKYYNTKNSEQWFDRSHNMIFDRAITGGILGLVAYLSLLLVPFYFFWQFYRQKEEKNDERGDWAKKYLAPIILSLLILSYIIQNMFIFEALVTYVPLFILLSFVGLFGPEFDWKFLNSEKFKATAAWLMIILIVPAIYIFNIKPLSANTDFIKVLSSQNLTVDQRFSLMDNILGRNTLGNQEYRRHFLNLFNDIISQWIQNENYRTQVPESKIIEYANRVEKMLQDQIRENPYSVSNYLMFANFYNSTYFFGPEQSQKAVEMADKAIELSPGRPQVYYTKATAYYYQGIYLENQNVNAEEVKNSYQKAIDSYYIGVNKNLNDAIKLGDLANFIYSTTANKTFIATIKERGINGISINDILNQAINWSLNVPKEKQDEAQRNLNIIQIALSNK